MRRDRIFAIVMVVVLGNLCFYLMQVIYALTMYPTSFWLWSMLVADSVGIIGTLWFMRTYRKARKAAKQKELDAQK
jgi:protein-S-isoprenylcysteine O-methyltransferase Ste14